MGLGLKGDGGWKGVWEVSGEERLEFVSQSVAVISLFRDLSDGFGVGSVR